MGGMTEAMAAGLRVRGVRCDAVLVPLRIPLGTSAATVREAPLLLVDLETEEGIVGRAYLFGYTPSGARAMAAHLEEAVGMVAGRDAAPRPIARLLQRRYALLGVDGAVRMALSALDVALWDALAISRGVPLATLLGAAPRAVPAYNSSGLGLMAPDAAADQAEHLLARGFTAVKLRLGHATLAEDMAVAHAVRRRLPDTVSLMVDYNQALGVVDAIRRGHRSRRSISPGSRSRRGPRISAATPRSRMRFACRYSSARTSTGRRAWPTRSPPAPAIS